MNESDLSLKHSTTEFSKIGEKLRYARESKGLSLQEVSSALCLSVSVIDALERDAHEKLPAPVFIKGYLKNYADFLQLPLLPEDIQIEATDKDTQKYAKKNARSSAASSSVSSGLSLIAYLLLKLLNYAVLPAFLVLIFLWWHEKHHDAEKALSMTAVSSHKNPFPRLHIQPMPPDITPWLDVEKGDAQ